MKTIPKTIQVDAYTDDDGPVCAGAKCTDGGVEKCCHKCDKFNSCISGWKCDSPGDCIVWGDSHKIWRKQDDTGQDKENRNLRLALQSIADDCETQVCGSFGMKRLAGYAKEALVGLEWIEELNDTGAEDDQP